MSKQIQMKDLLSSFFCTLFAFLPPSFPLWVLLTAVDVATSSDEEELADDAATNSMAPVAKQGLQRYYHENKLY